jgi:hypothetical protein
VVTRAVPVRSAVPLRAVGDDPVLLLEPDVTAEELLKLCHAFLRGSEINDPDGCKPIDRDTLARLINLYLNEQAKLG